MNCEEARQQIIEVLDGRVATAELNEHLTQCETCRTRDAQMRRIFDVLDELHTETESVSSIRDPALLHEYNPTGRPGWHGFGFNRPMRIAAAIVFMIGCGVWYVSHDASGPQPSPSVVHRPTIENGESDPDQSLGLTLQGETADKYMAVAVAAAAPNVDLYWLYPVLQPTKEN